MPSITRKNIAHLGDILAIPFFLLTFLYFYKIEHKTMLEYLLMLFSFLGGILDILFTYLYYNKIE